MRGRVNYYFTTAIFGNQKDFKHKNKIQKFSIIILEELEIIWPFIYNVTKIRFYIYTVR